MVTALVVKYLQKAGSGTSSRREGITMKITTKFWIGLVIFIVLIPFGIDSHQSTLKPALPGVSGEPKKCRNSVGYIPKGLEKLSRLWNAPLPDYAFKGWEEKGLTHLSFAYIISAILGIAITVLVIFLIGKVLVKKRD